MTRPDEAGIDAALAAMLAPPGGAGDRAFLACVDRAIDAEAALVRAERRFLRSFAFEALAVGDGFGMCQLPLRTFGRGARRKWFLHDRNSPHCPWDTPDTTTSRAPRTFRGQ